MCVCVCVRYTCSYTLYTLDGVSVPSPYRLNTAIILHLHGGVWGGVDACRTYSRLRSIRHTSNITRGE